MACDINTACACYYDLDKIFRCLEGAPPSLNTIRRAFTAMTMNLFANVGNVDGFSDVLGCRTYSPDNTQISIGPIGNSDPGDTEHVPGIVISLGEGLRLERAGIGDHGTLYDNFSVRVPAFKGDLTVTFKCSDYDADIACAMADLVLLFFTAMQERMYETWGWLLDYLPVGQTEPALQSKEGDTDTKWYEATVSLRLGINYSVFTSREAPPLKDASIDNKIGNGEDPDVVLVNNVPHDGHWRQYQD